MKVLVIAPHMDDEVLGAGGTIARHVADDDEVYVCFVTNRAYDHKYDAELIQFEKECALKAKDVLGYKEAEFLGLKDERLDACLQDIIIPLEAYTRKIKPETIYVCHGGDNNQDHCAVFNAAMVVVRTYAASAHSVLCYEIASSTEQAPPFQERAFLPNAYVNIDKYLAKKLAALACYSTETKEFPHPRSVKSLEALALKRGYESNFEAAEAFVIVRHRR